jgi:NAD(P)-dependent dehydrogenase (short-subunit alcohol dehydrogenase family)
LQDRVAIVTGSSRGIGLAIARRLADAGASVMRNARTTGAPAAGAGVEALPLYCADVATRAGAESLVAAALARFGRLHIVINNAGVQPSGPWADASGDAFDAVMAGNARSVEHMIRAALPALEASRGAVVNVASVRAERPGARMAHYAAAKAAVVALTRALAVELGPRGIRINAVSPGLVDRPGLAEQWPEGVARFTREAPLGRIGDPSDVADACLFLASPAASWITGVNLAVDGGISLVR